MASSSALDDFEDCPVCGKCGNWYWLGVCGTHPRKKPPSLGGFKGRESSEDPQSSRSESALEPPAQGGKSAA